MVFYTQPYFDNFHSFFFPNVPRFPSFFISFLFREFPFSHYFSIDLLVTDSLIFPSFENVFLFPPLFLKFPFTGCRILGWKFFFFFSIGEILCCFLLASLVSYEKSVIQIIFPPIGNMSFFSHCFQEFSFVLYFRKFGYDVYLCKMPQVYPIWDLLSYLNLSVCVSCQIWNFFAIISSNTF